MTHNAPLARAEGDTTRVDRTALPSPPDPLPGERGARAERGRGEGGRAWLAPSPWPTARLTALIAVVLLAVAVATLAVGCHKETPQAAAASDVEYTCSMHPQVVSDHPGKCPICGMALIERPKTEVQYTCPMHPEVISDSPGKCPKCGMNLVPMTRSDQNKAQAKREWYCPRHPGKLYGPGERCEICGLELARLVPGESEPPPPRDLTGRGGSPTGSR